MTLNSRRVQVAGLLKFYPILKPSALDGHPLLCSKAQISGRVVGSMCWRHSVHEAKCSGRAVKGER